MTNLDAKIRARLDAITENDDDCRSQCGRSCADDGYAEVLNALIAVLELSRRVHEDWTHVSETSYELGQRMALEEAVNAIGEALGIGATDA